MTVHLPLTLLEFEYLSQYRHDYPPRPLEGRYGPNMDSVRLRQSHFALGDYVLPYRTSSMDQSKDILTSGAHPAFLDEKVKSDLRRSHFVFGNSEPNFQSQNQRDYYDKFNLLNRDGIDSKSIERNLLSLRLFSGMARILLMCQLFYIIKHIKKHSKKSIHQIVLARYGMIMNL